MTAEIIAAGAFVPAKTVTNDDLAKVMDTNDEWIRTRTGIRERRIADSIEKDAKNGFADEEKAFKLALGASENAIAHADEALKRNAAASYEGRDGIDMIIVATSTPDYCFPAVSCRLQAALGLEKAAAFDISLACSGFVAALSTANAYIKAGIYKNILIVGVDVLSRLIDWADRSTSVLFGDAAGAVLVSANTEKSPRSGIIKTALHSDGNGATALCCKSMYFNEDKKESIFMDGRRVYEFAVRKTPEVIKEVLEGFDGEIKQYVLHQANIRIIEAVAKRLKEPMEKFPHNIESYGNTTAASIPLLLDELIRGGRINKGDALCMSGFGAGLSYGAVLLNY